MGEGVFQVEDFSLNQWLESLDCFVDVVTSFKDENQGSHVIISSDIIYRAGPAGSNETSNIH